MDNKTMVITAIRGFGLVRSRLPLIRRFISNGWQVVVATVADEFTGLLRESGVIFEALPFTRGRLSPAADVRALMGLSKIFRKYRPTLIHNFHGKPIIFGGIAAAAYPPAVVVSTVTGLGHAFIQTGIIHRLSSLGYRLAFRRNQAVIFQNPDDMRLFIERGWVAERKASLIVGSGINTQRFIPVSRSQSADQAAHILMVARLLWQKGVREYVEAAEIVKREFPTACFYLGGEWDPAHPDGIEPGWLDDAVSRRVIDFLGYLKDMPIQLNAADLFVLPSYYPEGVPRVLLEAASCGVPVVTTDAPGCKEAVVEGETGLLVPPQDSQALAQAICTLLRDPELRFRMGQKSRRLAEQKFDVRQITDQYMDIYRRLGVEIATDAA